MCVKLHIFYLPFSDYNRPKTNIERQRYLVFVLVTVQGRILWKRHQKQPKRPQTSTRFGKVFKAESKKKSTQEKPVSTKQFHKSSRRGNKRLIEEWKVIYDKKPFKLEQETFLHLWRLGSSRQQHDLAVTRTTFIFLESLVTCNRKF